MFRFTENLNFTVVKFGIQVWGFFPPLLQTFIRKERDFSLMDVSQAQASRYSGSVYSFVSDFCDLMYTGSGA